MFGERWGRQWGIAGRQQPRAGTTRLRNEGKPSRFLSGFVAASLAVSGLVASAVVGLPAPSAQAYQAPTGTAGSGVIAFPSGVQVSTSTTTGPNGNSYFGNSTIGGTGYFPAQFSPAMGTSAPAVNPNLSEQGAACGYGVCDNMGTITFTFSQPVTNPRIHVAGIAGASSSPTTVNAMSTRLTLTTPGATLSYVSGSNLTVAGGQRIQATNPAHTSVSCDPAASVPATCGTVQVNGTVTSLTFSLGSSLTLVSGSADSSLRTRDGYIVSFSMNEDFGDAPASYEQGNAARHVISDVRLGTGITADNVNVQNSATSPLSSANASADVDDAFTTLPPVSSTNTPYTVRVPLSGASKAGNVCGWIDFNKNGIFDADERACAIFAAGATGATLSWTVPSGVAAGTSFVRLRVGYSSQSMSPTGVANSGEVEDYPIAFRAPALAIAKSSDAGANAQVGQRVAYTVTLTNTGAADYTVAVPAMVSDDLADVLDDATYNDDAVAAYLNGSQGSAPVLTGNSLNWTGPLPAGQTVTLTYSVTLTNAGDGTVLNTACIPAALAAANAPLCASTRTVLPRLSIDKSADRTDLPSTGDEVTYTVVVTNQGPGAYTAATPATATDDLAAVLDDATFNDESLSASTGTVSRSGTLLTWAGPLAAGASATISYTVTYTGDGDARLVNNACVPQGQVAPGYRACDSVTIPGAELQQWKTAVPSSNPVVAGSTITYTLFFDSDGQTAAAVDAVDDLTHVLDDATVTTEPSSTNGLTAVRAGDRIAITGSVPAGQVATVSYTVTVLPDDERGDSIAANFLLAPNGQPPADPDCDPVDPELPNCTTTPITGVAYSKAVVASETPTVAGTELTYTVSVRNTGSTVVDVVRDDDLTDVLDDATMTGGPISDASSVTVEGPTANVLAIRGELEAGETATITYTVTVKDTPDRGDSTATNFLLPPGTTPPTSCDPVAEQCTVTPIQGYTVSKTADVSVANPGSTVTYTVTLRNTGAVAFTDASPATFEDDLGEVLDDATYNGDVTAGGSVVGDSLTWSGPLPVGATVAVTYSVTVNDPATGDQVLRNAVVPTSPGGECGATPECAVETPVASFTVAKTVDVESALPGDVVTYTVTVTNTGQAAYTEDAPASFSDDLSAVLDDATYNDDVSAGGSVTDTALSWSGPLAAGERVTVTYSVTVNDPPSGDRSLVNTVAPTAPGGTCDTEADCATTTPIGSYTVRKSTDVATAFPGDVVTYTVTVTNTSEVDYTDAQPASFTDDLSDVLDDAMYNEDATGGATVTGSSLAWTGGLAAGEMVVITYSVTIDNPVTGDFVLRNVVAPTAPGGSCTADGECQTETPISALRVVKTADAVDVLPGETVTYTITVTNTGQVPYTDAAPASFSDDLTAVLDDATYNGDAASSSGDGVTYAAPVLSWSGPLGVGEAVTISYSVMVNDPATGDRQLDNAVVTPPDIGGNCEPGSTDPACVENVPSGSYSVEKVASSATALPGDTVTYTVTVTNTGEVAYTDTQPASFTDDLARVLDDATYNGDISPGGSLQGTTLTWSGALAVGETLQVTYTVTVDDPVAGDFTLRNVVAPTSPGGECVEGGCITDTPIAGYTVKKTSDEVDTVLGGAVTYSITVTNIGQVPYTDQAPATFTDDLSKVLDDATFNDVASEGATLTGNYLTWAGPLPVGGTATVTYSVTVNDPGTGDRVLENAVLADGPGGRCAADDGCVTRTPVASYRVLKTVSTVQAAVGERVTFTIRVSNTGQVPYTIERPASFTDDLSSTLAVATYNNDATNGAQYSAPVLSWEGDLGVGAVQTITYTVTMTKVGDIRNVVVTPDGSGANCAAGADDPDCAATTRVVPPGLAITGGQMWTAGAVGAAGLFTLGLLLVARRRRENSVGPMTVP